MSETADVIIIGAGIVGCSIALSLSRARLKTINIDALPAAGYGSTSHSSAIIRPFYSHIEAVALAHESRFRWLEWQDFLEEPDEPATRYRECGMATLLFEGGETWDETRAAMSAVGVDFEILTPKTTRDRFPGLATTSFAPPRRLDDPEFGKKSPAAFLGSIFIPQAGYVNNPQGAATDLMRAAKKNGARFRFNAKVTTISGQEEVTGVTLEDGTEICAPILINAAGPHSAKVNAMAGIQDTLPIKTQALRQEVTYLPRPADLSEAPVALDTDAGIYFRTDGTSLLVGSLEPPCDVLEVVDPDTFTDAFTDQWTLQAWRAGLRFPDLTIPGQASGTVALYDVSDDWIPIYDKTDREGFFLAIGTSGNQFKNAPLIGDVMKTIILDTEKGVDTDATPSTLDLRNINRTISLAHYSRRRDLQATTNVLA